MEYNCEMIGDKKYVRYLLENKGNNQLMVIGLNPSTASDSEPDNTMRRIMGFAENNGFDGFLMMNLYPQRCTNPKNLDKQLNEQIHNENLKVIRKAAEKAAEKVNSLTILLGFGSNIMRRTYLKACLIDIVNELRDLNPQWKCIKLTKAGHPGHPLYLPKDKGFEDFDMDEYIFQISTLKKSDVNYDAVMKFIDDSSESKVEYLCRYKGEACYSVVPSRENTAEGLPQFIMIDKEGKGRFADGEDWNNIIKNHFC